MSADQLALPIPKQPAVADECGLLVNEVMLNSLGSEARGWWFEQSMRFEQIGRGRIIDVCIAGAILEVGPFARDDAEFMRDHMIEHGIHKNVIKIRKWIADLPACTRKKGPCVRCGRSHSRNMDGSS